MVSFEMNDRKKIGLGLAGFGVFFSFLGIIFFFDKGLLAIGNILFLSGVTLSIGLAPSLQFFMKPSNFKGTVSYGVGFFLVIIGWPIIGMIVETYGFFLLFSCFSTEDSCCWLGVPAPSYKSVFRSLSWETSACVSLASMEEQQGIDKYDIELQFLTSLR